MARYDSQRKLELEVLFAMRIRCELAFMMRQIAIAIGKQVHGLLFLESASYVFG